MDTLPTSSSVSKTPGLFSTSASASFHSRLTVSSSSSQRRLRALSRSDVDEPYDCEDLKSPAVLRSAPSSTLSSPTLPVHASEKIAPSERRSLLYCGFAAYCLLSVAFFTYRLFNIFWNESVSLPKDSLHLSPINDISPSHLLTKLLPAQLHPASFQPYAFASQLFSSYSETDVTACLWLELPELLVLEHSLKFWHGPLSLVILLNSSSEQKRQLSKILKKTPNITQRAVVHTIEQSADEGRFGNTYLNLARLFARTRYVVLFPTFAEFSEIDDIHQVIVEKIDSTNSTLIAFPQLLGSLKASPSLFRAPPPLSPLLIDRKYPIWCAERFLSASREADWQECLWQFWLYSYGSLPILDSGWEARTNHSKKHATTVKDLVHRRLSNRFRHETCMLAANSLKEKSPNPRKVDPHKAQWLRKTCKEAINWDDESP